MRCMQVVVAVNARGGGVGVAGELASQVCMHACMPWSSTRERWRGGGSVVRYIGGACVHACRSGHQCLRGGVCVG